jgi:hypothetical protein
VTEHSHEVIRNGISQRLRSYFHPERELPPRISALVTLLDHRDAGATVAVTQAPGPQSKRTSLGCPTPGEELNAYLDKLIKRLPDWFSRLVIWLRDPKRVYARVIVSVLLMAGGILSFLPVLGVWMLPLGLIIISQDLQFMQGPLVRTIKWVENKYVALRDRVKRRRT